MFDGGCLLAGFSDLDFWLMGFSFEWSMVVCWLVAVFLMVGGVLVVVFPSYVEFFLGGSGVCAPISLY